MRRMPGTASMMRSCRLPSSSGASKLTPVVLPPGRRIDGTKPSPTMSSLAASIGIVFVAAWAARVAIGPAAIIASGAALTSGEILILDEAEAAQFLEKCRVPRLVARGC